MKRRITALIFCFCILFMLSAPAFAAEEHTAFRYFWAAPSGGIGGQYISYEEFDNDYPFDPGLDDELTSTTIKHLLIGAMYSDTKLQEGAVYRFDLTLVCTPTVSIQTVDCESMYDLCVSTLSNMDIYYGSKLTDLSGRFAHINVDPVITRDGSTITFSFIDISWEELWPFSSKSELAFYIAMPTELLSISGDLYLANIYWGLQSDYDEEGYSKVVNEKLDSIDKSIQDGNEKLDQIFNQDKEQHEETKGFLDRIITGITSLPDLIKNAFKNLIDEIVGSVTGSIQDTMNGFLDNLKDKLGILYQAPDYFIRVIQSILITESTNELVFPSMIVPVGEEEYTLNDPVPFEIFPEWIPSEVYSFINLSTSITVIFSVINYADKKWESITNNG